LDVRSRSIAQSSIIRNKRNGLGADGKGYTNYEQNRETNFCSWDRVFVIYDAIAMGFSSHGKSQKK
jgi:hypothetical protein